MLKFAKSFHITAVALVAGITPGALAAPVATLDDQDFTYRWDFDGANATENYDRYDSTTGALGNDGTNEWVGVMPTPSGGVITLADTNRVNGFWRDSAAAASQITTATGYTHEVRMRITPDGTNAVFATYLTIESPGAELSTTAAVTAFANDSDPSMLDLYYDLSGKAGGIRATVAANEFFTVRIAATPSVTEPGGLTYTMYVNDDLAADVLPAERTTLSARRHFLGTFTGGTSEIDYTAFTAGAFAPIPEPGSLALIGLGMMGLVARRRRA